MATNFPSLLEKFREGEATPEEMAELDKHLRADPANRRLFVDAMLLEIHLHKAFAGLAPLAAPAETVLPASIPAAKFSLHRIVAWGLMAAAFLLAASLFIYLPFGKPDQLPLVVESGQVQVGDRLARHLPEGKAFEVMGEKPACFLLADGSRTELEPATKAVIHGRVGEVRQVVELTSGGGKFLVEHAAGQFRVDTPVGSVTALGTEFTVKLQPARKHSKKPIELAVAVYAGKVRVDSRGKSWVLAAGKKRVFGDDGDQNNQDDGNQNNQDNNNQGK